MARYSGETDQGAESIGLVTHGDSERPELLSKANDTSMQDSSPPRNKRSYWAIALFLFYAALSIASWTLTCILSTRPINFPSYYNQTGNYTTEQYEINDRWREATVILRTLSATIVLPVTTAIASQAAVVYTQRKDGLSLRQMLALADRGWSDFGVLLACVTPKTAQLIWSPFLLFVLCLTLIGLLIQPLQSLFIRTESRHAMTCLEVFGSDDPLYANCDHDGRPTSLRLIGKEPGLKQISTYPLGLSVNEVMGKILHGEEDDSQAYLWANSTKNDTHTLSIDDLGTTTLSGYLSLDNLGPDGFSKPPFFVSSFLNGTSTGILRVHALAMQTHLKYEYISRTSFPDPCPGDFPFTTEYNYAYTNDYLGSDNFTVRVCVPGDYRVSPFAKSRDRQVVEEEMYFDMSSNITDSGKKIMDTTQRYIARTSRGYFELPNMWNNYSPGSLLEKWPSQKTINREFNDNDNGIVKAMTENNMTYTDAHYSPPDESCYQTDDYSSGDWRCSYYTPGPLTVSALSIFGRRSLFDTVRLYTADENAVDQRSQIFNRTCLQLQQPFNGFGWSRAPLAFRCGDYPGTLGMHQVLTGWLENFSNWSASSSRPELAKTRAYSALGAATFYANLALMTKSAAAKYISSDWRPVFTSDGQRYLRLQIGEGAVAPISTLLALQLAGLALLTIYGVSFRTWTRILDSFAMLRIGASADPGIPSPIRVDSQKARTLDQRDVTGRLAFELDLDASGEESKRTLPFPGVENIRRLFRFCDDLR